jgi:hypothetical protein
LGPESGWSLLNGEECVVISPKTKMNCWCENMDGNNRNFKRGQWRYWVRYGGGTLNVIALVDASTA